jgi:hypothetical protein
MCFACVCVGQTIEKDGLTISYDRLIVIKFSENSINLTDKDKKTLDFIGDIILNNASLEINFVFEVLSCEEENQRNENIEYKRVKIVLDYLKEHFNINRERLLFRFIEFPCIDGFNMQFMEL